MNAAALLQDQERYFTRAYEQFCAFGGPCVYFHRECLRAGESDFLSDRQIEMLYATLTAWGMHRMGDSDTTKTKLTGWDVFRESLRNQKETLEPFRKMRLEDLSVADYNRVIDALEPSYRSLRLSVSGATVVVNSKALFHLLPHLIPPIDRQYTIRFFRHLPEKWADSKGRFRTIMLPAGIDAQFALFRSICGDVKRLVDEVDDHILENEYRTYGVTVPKAIDNAIVNFIRLNSGGRLAAPQE